MAKEHFFNKYTVCGDAGLRSGKVPVQTYTVLIVCLHLSPGLWKSRCDCFQPSRNMIFFLFFLQWKALHVHFVLPPESDYFTCFGTKYGAQYISYLSSRSEIILAIMAVEIAVLSAAEACQPIRQSPRYAFVALHFSQHSQGKLWASVWGGARLQCFFSILQRKEKLG